MQRVEEEIARLVKEINYDAAESLFKTLSGGKRVRAKLILKIAKTAKEAPLLAAIVELIHAASLLHDDVIDEATTRRGVASINATQGSKTAVMLGDILYSKAYSELVSFDKEIAKLISNSVTALSIGEMMDVEMSKSFNSDSQKYLEMLYLKTATLIEACAASAAVLESKDSSSYALFGKNLGLSFQIIDDILDIVSDEKTLGKPAMNDFAEGKTTLPYIYLYEQLQSQDKAKLVSMHGKKLNENDSMWVIKKFKEYGCIEKSFALAKKLSDEAKEIVKNDEELVQILETMIKRSY